MAGALARIFSAADSLKRRMKDAASNPLDYLNLIAGQVEEDHKTDPNNGLIDTRLPALTSQQLADRRLDKQIESGLNWVSGGPGAMAGVVKKIGPQQWLGAGKDALNGINEAIQNLYRNVHPQMANLYPHIPEAHRAEWINALDPFMKEQAERYPVVDAGNKWVAGPLANYIKGQGAYKTKGMGTPGDAIRELADQGITHYPMPSVDRTTLMDANYNRNQAGFPVEPMAQTNAGKNWEDQTDALIGSVPAKEFQDSMRATWAHPPMGANRKNLTPEEIEKIKRENEEGLIARMTDPWAMKVPGDTTLYELRNSPWEINRMQFGHLQDLLEKRLQSGELRPDQVGKVSVEDMVKYADMQRKIEERAALKNAESLQAAAKAHIDSRAPEAEYSNVDLPPDAEGNPVTGSLQFHKYDANTPPEELAQGLSIDTEFLNHCLGGVDHGNFGYTDRFVPMRNIVSGKPIHHELPTENDYFRTIQQGQKEVYSVRDNNGIPHATIDVNPE